MNYIRIVLIIILSEMIYSCKSPNQVDQKGNNNPPMLTFAISDSVIYLGDTLRLTLHASDETLSSGTVNYGDSSVVAFSNLHPVIDTTLSHIYKSIGTYNITLSFNDGNKVAVKEYQLTVLSNLAFKVIIKANKTTVNFYDPFILTLHASDSTLSYGSLDFNDGNIVQFYNLNHTLDTSFSYQYYTVGTRHISASFSNSKETISKVLDITVVSDPSPGVSWEFNSLDMECGDTIKIHIFAVDPTLSDGSIDFKDGTVLSFNRSNFFFASHYYNYVNAFFFDTTITHVYSRSGKFQITVIFNDGISSTTKEADASERLGTLVTNITTIKLGDSLRVKLHATNKLISNATLDFQDGTLLSFNNVHHPFDTTIAHVYAHNGSYSINAIFSDGNTSTTSQSNILVQRYYMLFLKTGMEWQFAYNYSMTSGFGSYNRYGIHDWKIISSSVNNQDTIFIVQCIENDTISGGSSYIKDTSYFTITYSYSAIQFPAGSNAYIGGPYIVPNHGYVTDYPVKVGNNWSSYFLFEDYIGPTYYHYQDVVPERSINVILSLIKFIIP